MAPATTFTSIETPSISNLKLVIDNWSELLLTNQMSLTKSDGNGGVYNPIEKLKEYQALISRGKVSVTYHHSARAKMAGRQFVKGGLGLQSFSRKVRHTLVSDILRDYDIKNAHPTLLVQYCEKNEINCEHIKSYTSDRDKFLAELKGLSRDEAKELVLSVMNGGTRLYDDLETRPKWLREFKEQVTEIHKKIGGLNPSLVKAVTLDRTHNILGSTMNHILCDLENSVLVASIEYLSSVGTSIENAVLVFDGFMLPKNIEVDLVALADYVRERTGYVVEFCEKPMNEALDLTGLESKEIVNEYTEFEKAHFKVMRPICFVRETPTDIQLLTKTDLQTMYEHLPPVNKHSSFVQSWLTQENIRTYEKLDMLPPPLAVPDNTYNLWRGFPASRMESSGSHELGIQHIRNLFPDKIDSDWIITWLSRIIQEPGRKTGVCPVIIGGQGAGKGFLFEQMMGRIMGGYFAHTSDPEHSLFARFAENRNGKMLVNVDDCNVGTMKINADPFKSFITGERIEYEQKGKQTISLLNCSNYVMTTNNENPVKLDTDDRRYAIIACSKALVGNTKYFTALREYVEDDANIGALWKYLMEWDTSKINLARDRPMSQLYSDMKMLCADKELLYLGSLVQKHSGNAIFGMTAVECYDGFRSWLIDSGYGDFKPRAKISFGIYLSKIKSIEKIKRSVTHYQFNSKEVNAYLMKNGVNVDGVCLF